MKDLFLTNRFFALLGGVVLFFILAFWVPGLLPLSMFFLALAIGLTLLDFFMLPRQRQAFHCDRKMSKILSLGDENQIHLLLENHTRKTWSATLIDELPFQFQKRDFAIQIELLPGEKKSVLYSLRPLERGNFEFGKVHWFVSTRLRLVEQRISFPLEKSVPVFPSILQMKKLELRAFESISIRDGIKRMRRIGHSYEFEQIKNYVRGDDYRSINWKATGRKNDLMVNQYQDERSQQVYCLLDKSRVMKMPFDGLSLLDYAINSSLVISNIALQKHDKVGLFTFSDIIGTIIPADRRKTQLNAILTALYREKEHPLEANYELLYYGVRKLIPQRSLLLLYTNFESQAALDRVLPILRKINRFHLLVVVFFENTEILEFATGKVNTLEQVYTQTIAQKFVVEKTQMVQKLQQFGVQCILTRPQDLSVNTVNKYLELKARGLI